MWNEGQMKECSELASIQKFKPFDIVYGGESERLKPVHFILSGRCSILQYLNMHVTIENGCGRYTLQPPKKKPDPIIPQELDAVDSLTQHNPAKSDDKHTKSHFVEIGEFSCGAMFGLGEYMDDRIIVAKQMEVQCLLIPHYWLFQKKQNAGNVWQRTKLYLDFTLPSRQEVFETHRIAKKWKSYKKKLITGTQSMRPSINSTTLEDVPIICRLNDAL